MFSTDRIKGSQAAGDANALLPIGSVLTDLGLFNRPFGHFGSVLGLLFVKKVCFYSNLGK